VVVGVWSGVRVRLSVGYQDMGVWWAAACWAEFGGLLIGFYGLFGYRG
jgi:hypothetical protein